MRKGNMPIKIQLLLIYEMYFQKHNPCHGGSSWLANLMEKFYYLVIDFIQPIPKNTMYMKEVSGEEFTVDVRCACCAFWRGAFISFLFFLILIGINFLMGI
jgi:hypothetical protein